MNAAAPVSRARTAAARRWLLGAGAILCGAAVTAAAAVAGNGNLYVALAPISAVVGLALVWMAPIRYSVFLIALLTLGINGTGDGPWDSPLAPLGTFIGTNLNKVTRLPIALPLASVALLVLVAVHVHRRLAGVERIDAARGATAPPMLAALAGSAVAILALTVLGLLRHGGDVQMAKNQVQDFLALLLFGYLCAISLRGSRDHQVMNGIIVMAACMKALLALWVVYVAKPALPAGETRLAFATSHGDSIIFASAAIILIAQFAEQPIRRYGLQCLAGLPLIVAGMVVNNRRIVWMELAAALLTFWMISRRTRLKGALANLAVFCLPLFLVYVAAGLESDSTAGIFAPVRAFSSVNSQTDSSTLYRDLENYNLLATVREHPFVGAGFGHPFKIAVRMYDISFFKEFQFFPHNSLLGLWAFAGVFGFTGISLALIVAVFLAARSYECARLPRERVAAVTVIATIVIYIIQCWGDIGFSEGRSVYLVGFVLAVAGQIARSTGAWPAWQPRVSRQQQAERYVAA